MPPRKKILPDEKTPVKTKKQKKNESIKNIEENINNKMNFEINDSNKSLEINNNFDISQKTEIITQNNEIVEENNVEDLSLNNKIVEENNVEDLSLNNKIVEENNVEELSLNNEIVEENSFQESLLNNEIVEENNVKESLLNNEIVEENSVQESLLNNEIVEENSVQESLLNNEIVEENEDLINITRHENNLSNILKNNDKLKEIIDKLTDNTDNINNIDVTKEKEYILNENQITNILDGNINNTNKKYNLHNLMQLFSKFNEAVILIQIIDGNIKYIEKKGYESRNQSVIDLIIKTNNFKLLPNAQFVVFTNDYIDSGKPNDLPYLLTFCKNKNYKTNLFPNFNFNNWNEANIGEYENIYNNFINNKINWDDKKDLIFWSGSNTNIIRKKIFDVSKKYDNYLINLNINNTTKKYTITEHSEYKYLLNINGYSYAGRLNYLFLTGSCVIVLKNEDENKVWEEFYYKYFIPGEDYIEILYNDNENPENIIEKINDSIKNNDCLKISENGFNKAKKYLNIDNIYNYIHNLISDLSILNDNQNKILQSILYIPKSDTFYKNRINFYNNSFTFNFKGNDIELNIYDIKNNIINMKIMNNNTLILYNNNEIFNKYTPLIVSDIKNVNYEININKDSLNVIIDTKYNLIKCISESIEQDEFVISNIDIKTENGGWWIL
jgi:hypothetical protein